MSKKDRYKTVSEESETLIVEKKSKFISHVMPVDNETDAIAYLNKIHSKYPDATHNVYAYVIDENNIFRYSDDGEPSGTAGMPVLDTIRKSGIVDVIAVVTRYFGGTLLGTGGLVHAYSASADKGLNASGIIIREKCNIVEVKTDYPTAGKVQYKAAEKGYVIEDTVYDNEVTFKICSPLEKTQTLIAEMIDLTNGRAICKVTGEKYADRKE